MVAELSSLLPTPSPENLPAIAAGVYGGGITSFVILSSLVAASGGVLFGFELVISGGVTAMSSFLQKFFPDVIVKIDGDKHVSNYCKFDSQVLTAFTSSFYIAGLFASLIAARVTEKRGRRASMIAGGALFFVGSAVGGAAVNIYMLIFSRLLLGFGVGFTNQSIPIYLSEMAPPQYRGAISGGFDTCISLGMFLASLTNYGAQKIKFGWGWRISLSSTALPAAFLLVGTIFLPETPSSLIQRGGDIPAARLLLQKIRGTSKIDQELDDIVAAKVIASQAVLTTNPFLLLVTRSYRPYLVMAITLPIFLNITGIGVVTFYAPLMFRSMGLKETSSLLSAVIMRAIGLASTAITTLIVVDKVGRKALFLTGGTTMVVLLLVLGTLLKEELHDQGTMSSSKAYAMVIIVCAHVVAFGWSWGPMAWLVTSEMFSLEIRSVGTCVKELVNLSMSFVMAQSMLAMLCGLKAGLFYLFAGAIVVMTAFVYLFLPETKGVPIEKIGSIWTKHWYWKRFVMSN